MTPAKFKVGQSVVHPEAKDHSFPSGTGTIESVSAGPAYTYKVKCDATGQVLPVDFPEGELRKNP